MDKTSKEKLFAIKSYLRQAMNSEGKTVELIRREEAASISRLPKLPGIISVKAMITGLPAEWVRVEQVPMGEEKMILYFHGGSFISGSCDTHRDLAARISMASGARVLLVEYRLAPEHKFPAANEDCLAAYRWLVENGVSAGNVIFGGDSIGGSLALMTLLSLRDSGDPLPAAAFLLSPHTDLINLDGESYTSRAELDPMGSLKGNQTMIEYYLDPSETKPAILSPLRQDLGGLPSLLIQAGDHEVLLSDATRFAERAKQAGVDVTLEVWDDMWCAFQLMAYMLPEGEQAIHSIGEFVRKHLRN